MPTINDDEHKLYTECLQKQLDEIDLLSSIFCNPGEIVIYDPGVISDFNEFIDQKTKQLNSKLEYSINIQTEDNEKIDIQIGLPNLYPNLENATVTIRTASISKSQEIYIKSEIENYISTMDKTDGYIYQVVIWIQERIDEFLKKSSDCVADTNLLHKENNTTKVDFERLWIYSHHIKSKVKRHDIIQHANELNLTGFSRPGKPGIICVEGLKENTQEFWKLIKSWNWQKITIRKNEIKQKQIFEIDKCRRFINFKEMMLTEDVDFDEPGPMNMSLFMKFLDDHNSGYIKKDLFGFE